MASKNKESGKDSDLEPPPPNNVATGSSEDEKYFMTVALLFAKKSPDPSTKVGACIVNQEGNIVGVGYNKMPNGCEDNKFPWNREELNVLDNKYPYVCHAELNAIANKTSVDVKGCTIYVTLFPCNECAKILIQSGIRGVCYLSNKYRERVEVKAARRMLETAGVEQRPFTAQGEVCELLKNINKILSE